MSSEDDEELLVTKLSAPMLVPQDLLDDCQVDFMAYLTRPHTRPVPRVLSRREKFRDAVTAFRVRLAERLFKLIAGVDPDDRYWHES